MDALSEHEAKKWIFHNAFATSRVGRIGLELEWLVVDTMSPLIRIRPEHIHKILHSFKRLSFEPGGQLELSTQPADSLRRCLTRTRRDWERLRRDLLRANISIIGSGLDGRPPQLLMNTPRYAALGAQYHRFGHIGRTMMCNTASLQVNIDAGDNSRGWRSRQRRWWLANSLGPVLVAMFANSPHSDDAVGKSCRQVLRFQTDPSRTNPLSLSGDCRVAWTLYALDANVIGIPDRRSGAWTVAPQGLTMSAWLRGDGPRQPTLEDLKEHLKSVIPPVRACGHLELRMIDAQEDDQWIVPATVVSTLLDDEAGSQRAVEIAASLPPPEHRDVWIAAATDGLARPELASAAQECMRLTIDALDRRKVPDWAQTVIRTFAHRYTFQGLCPADRPRSKPIEPQGRTLVQEDT